MERQPQPGRDQTLQWLGETYASSLGTALESMLGERPEVAWKPEAAPADASSGDGPVFWWEQGFDLVPEPAMWIGIPGLALEEVGTRVLRAAGVDQVPPEEARSTALEVLTQAFSALAQALGDRQHCAVSAAGGRPVEAAPEDALWQTVWVRFADATLAPIQIAFANHLACALEEPGPSPDQAAAPLAAPPRGDTPEGIDIQTQAFKTLDLLRDVELPVSVSFGRARMPLEEVLKLSAGSVIELDRSINEPVALIVNDTVVALGEVVVIEGNYGLRIKQIMSRERLLRSSGVA